ncbi:CHAD domain-containing protein, partial [Cellulomonas algicola]
RVARAWRRLERRAEEAERLAVDARDPARHEVRKAARRARYAATTAALVVGRPARRSASRAHDVQDVLGRQQDTVVRRETLRRLGVQAHLDGDNAFTFGRLHALEQAAAQSAERDALRAIRRALAPKHRAWTT